MLELITVGGNVGISDIDNRYSITRKWNGINSLHFEISLDDPVFSLLAEEMQVHETTQDQTYVIKGVKNSRTTADIDCELDLDEWRKDIHLNYYNNTASIAVTMGAVCPANWSMSYAMTSTQRRSVNLDAGGTPLDIALEAQNSYGVAMQFDTSRRICTVYYPNSNPLSDTLISSSASMRGRPHYTGRSTDLITRIYPIGANGLTIEAINDGKAYVECHDYTDKILSQVWKDERYEDVDSLKSAAQAMVESMAVPAASWEIALVDLYRADPEKWPDHRVELYQKVRVHVGSRTISALVAEETIYPYHPDLNEISINSVAANSIKTLSRLAESLDNPNSGFNAEKAAAVANATKLITGSRGGHVVVVLDENNHPKEICVLSDTDQLSEAKSLWRWNESGLGHSSDGYNGQYALALTKDGAIVADRITVGTLAAGIIKAGILSDFAGKNYWNMETGEFQLSSAATIAGQTFSTVASNAADTVVANYDKNLNQTSVFNKLTNNGALKGIYMKDGVLYINADYLQSGQINAVNLSLGGKLAVYNGDTMGGYVGYLTGDSGDATTIGIGVSDSTGQNYTIASDSGVRMQAGGVNIHVTADGAHVVGDLTVEGNIYANNI